MKAGRLCTDRLAVIDGLNSRRAPGGDALQYTLTRNGVSTNWWQKLRGEPPKRVPNSRSGLIFDFAWSQDGKELALAQDYPKQ